jgi:hypothetical protein
MLLDLVALGLGIKLFAGAVRIARQGPVPQIRRLCRHSGHLTGHQ